MHGSRLQKGSLFTSGIKEESRGNLPLLAKKPATESTRAQGCSEYQEVFTTDARPPSRLEAPFNFRLEDLKPSWFIRGFCIKWLRMFKNGIPKSMHHADDQKLLDSQNG